MDTICAFCQEYYRDYKQTWSKDGCIADQLLIKLMILTNHAACLSSFYLPTHGIVGRNTFEFPHSFYGFVADPLYFAIENCYIDVFKVLIDHNVHLNYKQADQRTPFCLSCTQFKEDIVDTPEELAIKHKCAKLLLDAGADTSICCKQHKTMTTIWVLCYGRQGRNGRSTLRKLPIELIRKTYGFLFENRHTL
jgi:hypothetical protein